MINLDTPAQNVKPAHGDMTRKSSITHFAIERRYLNRIAVIAERLFTENRLDANDMRDCAQALAGIVEDAYPLDE